MRKNEIRCGKCNRLLAIGTAENIEIKCPRCGTLNHVRATSPNKESLRASLGEPNEGRQSFQRSRFN
ncbi:Com family DNA-binding transcriptional regulator [Maridesulfovibrio bastinii]|uniref:Com family DNA-binding transcriptional regulator n=1 Tax=Maridesulfovibrio bastinii TaxID=47157 RepID=UPI0009FC73E6|nr:Com family DNA-binding transcriptional regulator [Maridesulfovibrio bastinii]